jgi:hypothetical protein
MAKIKNNRELSGQFREAPAPPRVLENSIIINLNRLVLINDSKDVIVSI